MDVVAVGSMWEHLVVEYDFSGPALDPWPHRVEYSSTRVQLDRLASGDASETYWELHDTEYRLYGDWRQWCLEAEGTYLSAVGHTGFELVMLHRERFGDPMEVEPIWHARAYFKREVIDVERDEPPRPIGFRLVPPDQ
jgi:hypothetical protein